MPKSKTENEKKPVPISTATAVLEDEPDTQAAEPAEPPAETPPASQTAAPPRPLTFFERMNRIHKDDWGPRANIYLYRTEPMIDRTRGGDKKYVQCYAEPIGEERILVDHGSGRYKAVLNFKKPGAERGDEIDSHFFDLLNLAFPPKVPEGDWVDDPKNKRWAWARKAPTPPAPAPVPMSGMAEAAATLETLVNISDRMAQKAQPPAQPPPAATAAPAPVDPFDTAKKIMDMRTNDPMITLLLARMDAQDKAMEAARQREFELQKELREKPAAAAPAPAKGFFEQLMEFGGESIKTRIVDGLFGKGPATEPATVTRAGRMNTLEFISDFGPKALQTFAPLIDAAAHKIMNPPLQPNGNGTVVPPQNNMPVDPFQRFIVDIVTPKMLMYFNADPSAEGGGTFADWIFAGFPEFFDRLQAFEHPRLPGLKGEQAIITAYKNTPEVWPKIMSRESEFVSFVQGFCAWKPDTEPEEEAEDAEVVGPIDLTEEMEA